ncbi:jg24917 [Pararge aegeria aegeria]|uniref:Jg24917 protein n=1 Tax=Pararge aegeria aegeria TaxID=348720 RepID=A0A8S4QG04_9NEOP|nr:jg24917 [Pararge aegeria aegeria]
MTNYVIIMTDVANSTNTLAQELKRRLEAEGCTVRTATTGAASLAEADKVDCLVVVGAESKAGLDGISRLVSEDVYENLNLLESLAASVKRGGSMAWTCAGETSGAYRGAADAFDTVIQASLRHVAQK